MGQLRQHAAPCARRETGDKLAYAEEVLVSKSDLEENKQRIAELDAQVLAARARRRAAVQPPVCMLQRTPQRNDLMRLMTIFMSSNAF
jgi:hypothetical protein